MKTTVLLSALALLLAGCQTLTPEEIAAREAAIDAARDAECQRFGARPGTDAYVDCRLRLTELAQAERIERRRDAAIRATAPPFLGPAVIVERPIYVGPRYEECIRFGGTIQCRTY